MARKDDREFKIEAVRMASEAGVTASEVEARLGIGQRRTGSGRGKYLISV
jgi:transposase-like protein